MKIKAIMMDVDGTLTNGKKKIPPKTKALLQKAQEQGILLVLASGRPVSGLYEFAHELQMEQHHGLFVAFNGSKVIDCETKKVLFNETMRIEEGKAVLEHMKRFDVRPMIDQGDYMIVNDVYDCDVTVHGERINIIQYEARGGNFKLHEVDDMAQFLDYPLNKILTAGDDTYLQAHYQEMMEPFKDTLSCMFTAPMYFEFTAKGIDKAKALRTVLGQLDIDASETIAFGDGQNDCSMLQYAGIGVAMGNAVAECKEIADEITSSNEEEGIAQSLLKHLP